MADKPPVSSEAADHCPIQELVSLYHTHLPDNPKVKVLSKQRVGMIRARWNEAAKLQARPFGYTTRSGGLEAWARFFAICAESPFLTGKSRPQPGKPPFVANIDFLLSPDGFAKTIENTYHREVGA